MASRSTPTKKRKRRFKFKFQLLAGQHTENATTNPKTGKKIPGRVYKRGESFETDIDLLKLFGPSAHTKFRQLRGPRLEEVEPDLNLEEEQPQPEHWPPQPEEEEDIDTPLAQENEEGDELAGMTLKQLRNYAKVMGVDLGSARRKNDVIEAIRDELGTYDKAEVEEEEAEEVEEEEEEVEEFEDLDEELDN